MSSTRSTAPSSLAKPSRLPGLGRKQRDSAGNGTDQPTPLLSCTLLESPRLDAQGPREPSNKEIGFRDAERSKTRHVLGVTRDASSPYSTMSYAMQTHSRPYKTKGARCRFFVCLKVESDHQQRCAAPPFTVHWVAAAHSPARQRFKGRPPTSSEASAPAAKTPRSASKAAVDP